MGVRPKMRDASAANCFKTDFEIGRGQQSDGFLRPFHDADFAAVEVFPEPGIIPFFRIPKPIKIKVVQV